MTKPFKWTDPNPVPWTYCSDPFCNHQFCFAPMKTTHRPLRAIALEVRRTWPKIYFGAAPYLEAMASLAGIGDHYGHDDARSIVRYFLSNASTWRGEDAKRIKAELKAMLAG